MPLTVAWAFLGWLSLLGYLVIASVTLWRLWRPQKHPLLFLKPLLIATIVCHLLYLTEGAVTGWLKLDTPEAVAVVLSVLVAAVAFWQFKQSKMEAPLGFLLPLSAILLAFGSFEKPTQLSPELRRDILLVHVAFTIGGYLMLTLSFSSAVTHLLTLWSLKRKRSLALLEKLPPLETTERLTSQLVLLGFPLLVLGMVVGIVWARLEGKSAWTDPKVSFSILTGGVFAAYLHARFVRRWEAAALHCLVVVGFICLLVTFLAVRHTLAME
ncbi:MAG: hypothetical protein DFNUSKGM_000248 [Candidatus Fervidibacter sacchari]